MNVNVSVYDVQYHFCCKIQDIANIRRWNGGVDIGRGNGGVGNVYTLEMHVHPCDLVFHAKAEKK